MLYFHSKDKFINVFQNWLSRVENKSGCIMKTLYADEKENLYPSNLGFLWEKKTLLLNTQHFIYTKRIGMSKKNGK